MEARKPFRSPDTPKSKTEIRRAKFDKWHKARWKLGWCERCEVFWGQVRKVKGWRCFRCAMVDL